MVTFEPAMQQAAQSLVELETELRGAVAQRQLVLLYQPIVDLQTGELAGAEALVRWTIRPVGGSVPACSSHLPRRPG